MILCPKIHIDAQARRGLKSEKKAARHRHHATQNDRNRHGNTRTSGKPFFSLTLNRFYSRLQARDEF